MLITDIINETTTSGGIATVALPLGAMQRRNKKDETDEFNWSDYEGMAMEDRVNILEQIAQGTNLLESNDEATVDYFLNLNMADDLIVNDQYIPVLLSLANNKLMLSQDIVVSKLIKQLNDKYNTCVFELSDGRTIKLPNKYMGDKMIIKLFCFRNNNSYDQFRNVIKLKFNYTLPLMQNTNNSTKYNKQKDDNNE